MGEDAEEVGPPLAALAESEEEAAQAWDTDPSEVLACKIFADRTERSTGLRCVGLLLQNFQQTSVVHPKSTFKLTFAENET